MDLDSYRGRLYSSYVWANKRHIYAREDFARQRKNAVNTLWGLRGWLPKPAQDARVADLACGAGNLLSALRDVGYKDLVGVDFSADQVEMARQVGANVVEGDVFEFLREHVGTFDLITAFDLIEHLTKDEGFRLLDLIHLALRPGGSIILQTPNGDSPFAGAVAWSDLTHETQFTAVSLRHILEACGFSNIEFRETGPVPSSAAGWVRTMLWKSIRLALAGLHYVETGSPSTGIYTRVLRCKACRP